MTKVCGLRVLRGPDWEHEDADGGEGFLGTVTQLLGDHEVRVRWDMGQENTCRTGKGGKFDLRVFDTAQIGIQHPGTQCAHCAKKDVDGVLWRCQVCASCDLCSLCYSDDRHDTSHQFLRIDTPNAAGQLLPRRKVSVKVRTIGLHLGAKVVRGRDWEWGDQDGGQGLEGEVQGLEDMPGAPRSLLRVQWPNGSTYNYRLGGEGKVDVTCVEEEVGPFYYRDHLPLLDTINTSTIFIKDPDTPTSSERAPDSTKQSPAEDNVITTCVEKENGHSPDVPATSPEEQQSSSSMMSEDEELNVGDRVAIRVDEDELRELQKDRVGCTARMVRCIGRTGEVTGISPQGLVCVKFGISYKFNPKTLLKVPLSFSVNDVVRVRNDVKLLQLLNRRVGWKSAMDKTANKVGRVVNVDEDDDIRVDFRGRQFVFAPACCVPVTGSSVPLDSLAPDSADEEGDSGTNEKPTACGADGEASENITLFRHMRDLVKDEGRQVHGHSVRSLFAAIEFDDADHVRDICQQDPSMMVREHQAITPLICASLLGSRRCVLTLLDLGADVNGTAMDSYKKTPLSAVSEGKDEGVADLLLSRGADTQHLYGGGHNIAHLCVVRNKAVMMKALVNHGADLNAKDNHGCTPLHMAIRMRRHDVMEVLVAAPQVNIHLGNNHDFDATQLAAYCDNTRALERLLARDCSQIERLRSGHSTALHIAATNDHVDCVRLLLLQGGADINAKQVGPQQTALMVACHRAKLQTAEALLELGADVNLCDRDGDTALHLAIGGSVEGNGKTEEGKLKVTYRVQTANLLISSGAFVDAENHKGRSPFCYGVSAVRNGVKSFMKHNQGVVRRKRREADSVLQSLGVSGALGSQRPLKEALKGVQLPCGQCGAPRSHVTLQPCGHKCVCRTCSVKVTNCPLCDERVKEKVVSTD